MDQIRGSEHSPGTVSAPALPSPHLKWVDTAKGFGICLVVFEHTFRGLIGREIASWTPMTQFIDAWIYSFHMPLFFLLSGLFIFRSTNKAPAQFLCDKVRRIVYPYFVWSTITLVLKAAFPSHTNHPYNLFDLPRILYQPIDQFWFLYVLFILSIAVFYALKIGASPWIVCAVTLLLYPGFLPVSSYEPTVLIELRLMSVYFGLGVLLGNDRFIQTISDVPLRWIGAGIVGGLLLSFLAGFNETKTLPVVRIILGACGIVFIISLALLVDKIKYDSMIRLLGRYSLEIYVAHTIAAAGARAVLLKFIHVNTVAPHLLFGTFVGLCAPIVLALLFERLDFQYAFRFPEYPSVRLRNSGLESKIINPSMSRMATVGWIVGIIGSAVWLYGCLTVGNPPLIDWQANAPWWIASLFPNVQSEVGAALVSVSLAQIYGSSGRR
jgi:fucose 4-O-acetylase-like acetyltransferase